MPDDIQDSIDRFGNYYQTAMDKGADPLVLLFFSILFVALLVLGLKIWTDYKLKQIRLRAGYSPEPGEEREDASPKEAADQAAAVTRELLAEILTPILVIFAETAKQSADNSSAIREMIISNTKNTEDLVSAITARDEAMVKSTKDGERSHQRFMTDARDVRKGITNLTALFDTGYQSIVKKIVDSPREVGLVILDKPGDVSAWNKEGRSVFGFGDEVEAILGKPLGLTHNKALGSNLSLAEVIKTARDSDSKQIDVLELSNPGADGGKWKWYLLLVVPFKQVTLLLLTGIGDVLREEQSTADPVAPPPIPKKKPIKRAKKETAKEEIQVDTDVE